MFKQMNLGLAAITLVIAGTQAKAQVSEGHWRGTTQQGKKVDVIIKNQSGTNFGLVRFDAGFGDSTGAVFKIEQAGAQQWWIPLIQSDKFFVIARDRRNLPAYTALVSGGNLKMTAATWMAGDQQVRVSENGATRTDNPAQMGCVSFDAVKIDKEKILVSPLSGSFNAGGDRRQSSITIDDSLQRLAGEANYVTGSRSGARSLKGEFVMNPSLPFAYSLKSYFPDAHSASGVKEAQAIESVAIGLEREKVNSIVLVDMPAGLPSCQQKMLVLDQQKPTIK
jgi:hypothetical protein